MTTVVGGENGEKNSKSIGTGTKSSRPYTRCRKILRFRFRLFWLFDRIKKFVLEREVVDVKFHFGFTSFKVRKKKTKEKKFK